jgi:hypothetical protein
MNSGERANMPTRQSFAGKLADERRAEFGTDRGR